MPPADEKSFRHAGAHGLRSIAGVCVSLGGTWPLVLNGSVTYHEAAPIAWLPAAFEWPNEVPLFVANSSTPNTPWLSNQEYLTTPGSGTAVHDEGDEEALPIVSSAAREEQRRDVDRVTADVRIAGDLTCDAARHAARAVRITCPL